jgi:hypothetical protein
MRIDKKDFWFIYKAYYRKGEGVFFCSNYSDENVAIVDFSELNPSIRVIRRDPNSWISEYGPMSGDIVERKYLDLSELKRED